jgi:hypothetical protein
VDDPELRPEARQARAELGAQEGFVICYDGAYATTICYYGAYAIHAGTSIEATTPCGAFSSSTRWAAGP